MTAISKYFSKIIAAVQSAAFSFASVFSRGNPKGCQKHFVRHMQYLISDIFYCLVSDDYQDDLYWYERRVHKEKINCLWWMNKLNQHQSVEREHKCFSMILDAAQIRRRVTDHTIYALCRSELVSVGAALQHFIADFYMRDMAEVLSRLQRALDDFEDCYLHVVKVAAKEPAVFMLFIGALRGLQELAIMESGND